MSSPNRIHFNPGSRMPQEGVTLPDVFPAVFRQGQGHVDLHDIVRGNLPEVAEGEAPQEGWLIIASGNPKGANYTSPSLSPRVQERMRQSEDRRTTRVPIKVEETRQVPRLTNRFAADAFEPARFEDGELVLPENAGQLVVARRAETAIAFSGQISIVGEEIAAQGIHFRSGQTEGWLRLDHEPGRPPAEA